MRIFGNSGEWQGEGRLNQSALIAVHRAERASGQYGLRLASVDMLLYGLLTNPAGVAVQALTELRIEAGAIVAAVTPREHAIMRAGPDYAELDDAAREAVALGINEARRGRFERAGDGHLLLGAVQGRTGRGVRILRDRGIRVPVLRGIVNNLEQATLYDGAEGFASLFARLLADEGGATTCRRCGTKLHRSFNYCYDCGSSRA